MKEEQLDALVMERSSERAVVDERDAGMDKWMFGTKRRRQISDAPSSPHMECLADKAAVKSCKAAILAWISSTDLNTRLQGYPSRCCSYII